VSDLRIPPHTLVQAVDRAIPGIWPAFLNRVITGVNEANVRVGVSSWYRDRFSNARAGGSRQSQHLVGLGIDLVTDNVVALENALDAQGLVAINEGTHVHVQAFPAGAIGALVDRLA